MKNIPGWAPPLSVFLLAFLVRAGYVRVQDPAPARQGDAVEYHAYAENLLAHGEFRGFHEDRASRMPGYPLFLSGVYALFGSSTTAVLLAQCVLGALTCLLLYVLAASLLSPPWPLLCGLAGALYYDLILVDSQLLSESLYCFLAAASFAALYRRAWPAGWRAAAAGAGLGLSFLTRPEMLLPGGLVLLSLPLTSMGFRRREALLGLAALGLVCGIWVARNALVLHRFLPASSTGPRNSYYALWLPLSHSPDAPPVQDPPQHMNELQRAEEYRRARRELRETLSAGSVMKGRVFTVLSVFYPFLPEYDATYVFLIPLWLVGLWAARSRPELWPIAGTVLVLACVFTVWGGAASRYRFGLSPLLIVFAAAGAAWARERLGGRRLVFGAGLWAGLNACVWLWAPRLREIVLHIKGLVWG